MQICGDGVCECLCGDPPSGQVCALAASDPVAESNTCQCVSESVACAAGLRLPDGYSSGYAICDGGFACTEDGCVPCKDACEGTQCNDDGCGGSCGECPVECTSHDQCGPDQLCLGGAEEWTPATQVCGLCGVPETCQCGTPTWPAQYACTTDADCEKNLPCGNQCMDCPACPKCVHGWCAYQTGEDVMCLCTGCA